MRNGLLLFFAVLLAGCYKEKRDYLAGAATSYNDDFENYAATDSLFTENHWSGNQLTFADNLISIDTTIVHSGARSLRCYARTTGDNVSKCSLLKNNFGFEQGEVIVYEAWYYIDAASLDNLFLVDFEDPAYISSSPGFRITFQNDGELCVERNKMEHHTLAQTVDVHRKFPLRQWVKLTVEAKLSKRKKGYVKLWQDNELILEHHNVITLPKDFIYATQGTVGFLRQVEVGITANTTGSDVVMYVDDIAIRKL